MPKPIRFGAVIDRICVCWVEMEDGGMWEKMHRLFISVDRLCLALALALVLILCYYRFGQVFTSLFSSIFFYRQHRCKQEASEQK